MGFNPSRQLVTKTTSISELFKSSYFEIPPNQREYRWGNENREKFWSDLVFTVEHDFRHSPGDPLGHFLGAIVVIGGEQSHEEKRWEVIDGQQRLTTITILADCLRSYVAEIKDSKIRRQLSHVLLDCVMSPGADDAPRIKLNRESEFYEKSLIENEAKEEKESYWLESHNRKSEVQGNIKEAFAFFYKSIEIYLAEEPGDRDEKVRALAEALTDNFYVLVVRAESLWLAYRLFETLNERGLDLSQADLIRNVLLQHARESGEKILKKVADSWIAFVDHYEEQPEKRLEMPQIIQFSYTFRHQKVRKDDIFDQVSKDLRQGKSEAIHFVNEFRLDASKWTAFLLGDLVNWTTELADSQYAIVDPLWKSHCAPLVMAAMDCFEEDVQKLSSACLLIEHYLFRQGLVCRDSVGTLQQVFSDSAALLRASKDLGLVAEFLRERSPNGAYKDSFKSFSVKNMKQGFYALWKIEASRLGDLGFKPKNQSAAQHLEHIIPRRPNEEWGGIEREDSFSSYVNRIGNLLVMPASINQHIKNRGIEYKIRNDKGDDYVSCKMSLAEEFVANFDEWAPGGRWDFESINSRQIFMAENYAEKVWSLELA